MKLCLYITAWLYLAAVLAAQAAAPVAPPNFRALPGVGTFAAGQVGRWNAATKKFEGVPIFADSTGRLGTAGTAVDPWTGIGLTTAYDTLGADGDHIASGIKAFASSASPVHGDCVLNSVDARTTSTGEVQGVYGIQTRATHAANDPMNDGTARNGFLAALSATTTTIGTARTEQVYGLDSTILLAGTSPTPNQTVYGTSDVISVTGGTTTDLALFSGQYTTMTGSATALKGISLHDWAAPSGGGMFPASDAIYIDASTSPGASAHAIRSLNTSPSNFAGDVAVTNAAKGVVLKDSVTNHFVRLTLANGVLTQTDLGTTTP